MRKRASGKTTTKNNKKNEEELRAVYHVMRTHWQVTTLKHNGREFLDKHNDAIGDIHMNWLHRPQLGRLARIRLQHQK